MRFAADENLNRHLVTGLQRRVFGIDIRRVQDAGLSGEDDPTVLAWAAEENRILLSHDLATIASAAYERVSAGLPMPGVFLIKDTVPLAQAIGDLVLVAELSLEDEWKNGVHYLPIP